MEADIPATNKGKTREKLRLDLKPRTYRRIATESDLVASISATAMHERILDNLWKLVRPERFERPTLRFVV